MKLCVFHNLVGGQARGGIDIKVLKNFL